MSTLELWLDFKFKDNNWISSYIMTDGTVKEYFNSSQPKLCNFVFGIRILLLFCRLTVEC
jgi:hypothetical protein